MMYFLSPYSGACLIRTANARKMRIIRAYVMLRFCQRWRVVPRTTMRIILEVRISEGQIPELDVHVFLHSKVLSTAIQSKC